MSVVYPAAEKLVAIRRELGFRRRVFVRRVSEGRMTQSQADHEIGVFEAIEADYVTLAAGERLL